MDDPSPGVAAAAAVVQVSGLLEEKEHHRQATQS